MFVIRGATTVEENTSIEIERATLELFEQILNSNNIQLADIISVIFSCTSDVTKEYPGKFLRMKYSLNNIGIMHFNEMQVEESLKLCIRIMIFIDNNNVQYSAKHIYLGNSKKLRKDLINSDIM